MCLSSYTYKNRQMYVKIGLFFLPECNFYTLNAFSIFFLIIKLTHVNSRKHWEKSALIALTDNYIYTINIYWQFSIQHSRIQSMFCLGSNKCEFQIGTCHSPAMWAHLSSFAFPSLSFLICNMINSTSTTCCNICKWIQNRQPSLLVCFLIHQSIDK